jgi:hypothetical protein
MFQDPNCVNMGNSQNAGLPRSCVVGGRIEYALWTCGAALQQNGFPSGAHDAPAATFDAIT